MTIRVLPLAIDCATPEDFWIVRLPKVSVVGTVMVEAPFVNFTSPLLCVNVPAVWVKLLAEMVKRLGVLVKFPPFNANWPFEVMFPLGHVNVPLLTVIAPAVKLVPNPVNVPLFIKKPLVTEKTAIDVVKIPPFNVMALNVMFEVPPVNVPAA